jgi:hypothetical protein
MPNPILHAAATLAFLVFAIAAQAAAVTTYAGAWFEIDAPADFTVRPSLPSDSADGFDSAFFTAPDGSVEFYVHAPQWGGEPTDIAVDPETESLSDERVIAEGPITRRWFTISADDGSYSRSYLTTTDSRGPTARTVGIRYRSIEDLQANNAAYLAFRDSLRQFAD